MTPGLEAYETNKQSRDWHYQQSAHPTEPLATKMPKMDEILMS